MIYPAIHGEPYTALTGLNVGAKIAADKNKVLTQRGLRVQRPFDLEHEVVFMLTIAHRYKNNLYKDKM